LGLSLFFVPFFIVIAAGQLSSFVAACLVFAWYLQRKERHAAAGILFVALLLKPHLVSLAAVLLVWHAWRRRAWPFFLSAAACLLLLVLVSFLLDPQWLAGWRAQGSPLFWVTQAPLDVLQSVTKVPEWLQFTGLALVGPLFLWHHRAAPTIDPHLLAKALLVSVVIAPYGYSFDTTVLLPTALFIGSQLWQRNQRELLALSTLLNVWFVPFHLALSRYFALLLLVVWLWYLSTRPEPARATRVAAGG
jgi:dipeptide/tripeptide permease